MVFKEAFEVFPPWTGDKLTAMKRAVVSLLEKEGRNECKDGNDGDNSDNGHYVIDVDQVKMFNEDGESIE